MKLVAAAPCAYDARTDTISITGAPVPHLRVLEDAGYQVIREDLVGWPPYTAIIQVDPFHPLGGTYLAQFA